MLGLKFSYLEKSFFLFLFIYCFFNIFTGIWSNAFLFGSSIIPEANNETFLSWGIFQSQYRFLETFLLICYLLLIKYFSIYKLSFRLTIFWILIIVCLYMISFILLYFIVSYAWVYFFHTEVRVNMKTSNFFLLVKKNYFNYHTMSNIFFDILSHQYLIFLYLFILKYSNTTNLKIIQKDIILKLRPLLNKDITKKIKKNDKNHNDEDVQDDDSYNSNEIANKAQILLIKKNRKEYLIHVDDIISVESDGNYMNIDNGGGIFPIRITLKALLLKLPINFIRIERSLVINCSKIKVIKMVQNNKRFNVILINGKSYLVGMNYHVKFLEHVIIKDLLKENNCIV